MADPWRTAKRVYSEDGHLARQETMRLHLFNGAKNNRPLQGPVANEIERDSTKAPTALIRLASHLCSWTSGVLRVTERLCQSWNSRFPGWRGGLAWFTILTGTVLVGNVGVLIWAITCLDNGPYATIAIRSSKDSARLSFWLGLIINALSTTLLAASNYCVQCLTSPTRDEIDNAHSSSKFLHIGAPSWRNTLFYKKKRICILAALLTSGIPLSCLSNNVISIQHANFRDLTIAWVKPEFLSGGPWAFEPADWVESEWLHGLHVLQNMTMQGDLENNALWKNFSAKECKSEYTSAQPDVGSLLLVVEQGHDGQRNSVFRNEMPLSVHSRDFDEDWPKHYFRDRVWSIHQPGSLLGYMRLYAGTWHNPVLREWKLQTFDEWRSVLSGWQTAYCLSPVMPPRSRLQIHVWLLFAVAVLNTVKFGCLLLTFWEQLRTPIMTTGDAIASFLRRPCSHSRGKCLLDENEAVRILRKIQAQPESDSEIRDTSKTFKTKQFRLCSSIAAFNLTSYFIMVLIPIVASPYLYSFVTYIEFKYNQKSVFVTDRDEKARLLTNVGLRAIWASGFNIKTPETYRYDTEWCYGHVCQTIIFDELIAATPHLLIAIIYILLNQNLSQMAQLQEWSSLAIKSQGLRVTCPETDSHQKSTYWLSLPYKYSIPQLLSSIILGWLASQGVSYHRERTQHMHDRSDYYYFGFYDYEMLVYSPLALLCFGGFAILIFVASIAFSFEKCAPGMPLGSSNSFIIAAACHPPEADRQPWRHKVQWGVVEFGSTLRGQTQHCTITSRKVQPPVDGQRYA